MHLLTHMLTVSDMKPLKNRGEMRRRAHHDTTTCCGGHRASHHRWGTRGSGCGRAHHKMSGGGGTPDRSAVFRPPTPFFTPRVRLPHFGNVSTPNSFPTHIDRNTELIPPIKPVDTPSIYPLPATTPQKQGWERNPIRYSSATELIPLIKPVDRIGDYNAPFSPLEFGNVSSPNSFPTNLRNIKPFCSGRQNGDYNVPFTPLDKNP